MHLQLDAARPFLRRRPPTTRIRKEAVIPLLPSLTKDPHAGEGQLTDAAAPGFKLGKKLIRSLRRDLLRTGFGALDALSQELDFPTLRKTFDPRLAGCPVAGVHGGTHAPPRRQSNGPDLHGRFPATHL